MYEGAWVREYWFPGCLYAELCWMAELAQLVWVQTDPRLSELYDLSSKAAWEICDQLKLSPPQSQAAHKYGSLKDSTRKSRHKPCSDFHQCQIEITSLLDFSQFELFRRPMISTRNHLHNRPRSQDEKSMFCETKK